MSTVQRKVFEQLKGFMVRITFNKDAFLQGWLRSQGRNSGKAPVPLGELGQRGVPREGLLGFCPWKSLEQLPETQLCASKPPTQALGAVCAIPQTSDVFHVPLKLPTAVSLPRTKPRTPGAELAPGHRVWAKLQIAQAVIYGLVSEQSCRFTVSCHLQG